MSEPRKWPLKYRIWHFLHGIVNDIAWEFQPDGFEDEKNKHWLWRLNDWLGSKYIFWWLKNGKEF